MKLALTALLAGTAAAVPYPPALAKDTTPNTKIAHFTFKGPGSGNYMPTSPAADSSIGRRQTGERVSNGNLATYNQDNIQDGVGSGSDSYTMYWGDGSTGAGWPEKSRWVSFENMFNNYKNTMFNSCSWFGQANDSGPEVGAIWDGIQESGGCVRVHTTNYGVRNPGLMQDHNGDATCNDNGWVQNPCPNDTIYKMILEGTAGTNSGDGLANCINQSGRGDVSAFYRAARIYNSGSISSTGQLQNGIATHCYASDIANRLTGWVSAPSKCNCDSNPGSCGINTN